MRALRAALENQAVLKTRGSRSEDMAQSSTWCYQLEVGSDIRIDHHKAAKTLDSTKKNSPGQP
jgi:hypothetical protein